MNKLITLEAWAAENYATPPHITTLRRWAREGKINPVPTKQGRTYYVQPGATYTDKPATPAGGKLLSRLKAYYGTQAA